MSTFWSPVVRELEPYVPGEQPQIDGLIKLNTNESPYPPSPKVIEAVRQMAPNMWMYGDPENHDLKAALAVHHGCGAENIVVGEGIEKKATDFAAEVAAAAAGNA